MPKLRPSTSGYARIVQAEEEDYIDAFEDDEDLQRGHTSISATDPQYAPIQPGRLSRMQSYQGTRSRGGSQDIKPTRPQRRMRSSSTVDIKAINARLERWAEEIAAKFKLRKSKDKSPDDEKLEIHYSVFQAPDDIRPATADTLVERFSDEADNRMSKIQFDDIVESVRVAIELGTHPKMISKGSSGSYFALNSEGKIVGVFKPKDEEPYATKNPKWIKWLHRNLFPWGFGRACLIPNLSYVSEAAACVLDARLHTNIVPYTDVVWLSSPAFNYDYWDRRAYYRKRKPLPPKAGSFQAFLKGYEDATGFLKEHPWPDQATATLRVDTGRRKRGRRWADECRSGHESSEDEEEEDAEETVRGRSRSRRRNFWTSSLQQSFREELEKLVILDYIMRNTDRGLDNWMIRIDQETERVTIVSEPVEMSPLVEDDNDVPYKREEPMTTSGNNSPNPPSQRVRIGAIDNSLSWPWKHPDAWRSYPFGWLFLPVSLIGQPFSEKTRQHFLPLLTSKQWWSETQLALRKCFMLDSDFQEKMFAKQMAVMKGQAWNVVETLKAHDLGPLELTRRTRVLVWDDLVDIPTALPMRPSNDETRKTMDVSPPQRTYNNTARDFAPEAPANLGQSSAQMTEPNRFNTSRQVSPEHVGQEVEEGDISLRIAEDSEPGVAPATTDKNVAPQLKATRPRPPKSRTRLSYDEPRSRWQAEQSRKRGYSFTLRRLADEPEEDDGDLGFGAMREQEGNRRKVIVERLETVKSKRPVFTWC